MPTRARCASPTGSLSSAKRMDRMVCDLLDLTRTRLGTGSRSIAASTDLASVCPQVVAEIKEAHPEEPVRFAWRGEPPRRVGRRPPRAGRTEPRRQCDPARSAARAGDDRCPRRGHGGAPRGAQRRPAHSCERSRHHLRADGAPRRHERSAREQPGARALHRRAGGVRARRKRSASRRRNWKEPRSSCTCRGSRGSFSSLPPYMRARVCLPYDDAKRRRIALWIFGVTLTTGNHARRARLLR